MERIDRSAVIAIAIALMVGFAIWQLLGSISYVATQLLVDLWEDADASSFGATFSIGSVDVEYARLLASLITLLLALSVAVPLVRYAARRRAAASRA